jgi:hypothetical protein
MIGALPRIIRQTAAFGGTGYDPDAQAYFAAMSVQPDATRKGLINDYIVGLKTDGVWSLLDLVYLLASHDSQAAGLNAKTPASNVITVNGTCTFTTDGGYTSNGTTGYLDTNFNPATAGGNWTQNSASLFSWVNATTSDTASTTQATWGNTVAGAYILPLRTSGTFRTMLNGTGAQTFTAVLTTRLGSRAASRQGAAVTDGQVNGAAFGTTNATASQAPTSENANLLRFGASYNGNDRVALATLGGGLTGTQMTALHNRSSTFLTAIGAN